MAYKIAEFHEPGSIRNVGEFSILVTKDTGKILKELFKRGSILRHGLCGCCKDKGSEGRIYVVKDVDKKYNLEELNLYYEVHVWDVYKDDIIWLCKIAERLARCKEK